MAGAAPDSSERPKIRKPWEGRTGGTGRSPREATEGGEAAEEAGYLTPKSAVRIVTSSPSYTPGAPAAWTAPSPISRQDEVSRVLR